MFFGSFLISETSQEWGRILCNPWQCKLKLKYMKNLSFGALHSPFSKLGNRLPSQSKMQGRKLDEEIQQPTFSHGYAKISHSMRKIKRRSNCRTEWKTISHTMRNLKRQLKKFCTPCVIFLCTDSVIFLSPDILCNFLFSPCNQPRYFHIYLFIFFGNIWGM